MTSNEEQRRRKTAKAAAEWWSTRVGSFLIPWQKIRLERKARGIDTPFDHLIFPRLDALSIFQNFLEQIIFQMMEKEEQIVLRCDFRPTGYLLDAARVSGIPPLFFRFRAEMTVKRSGKVGIVAGQMNQTDHPNGG